MTAPLYTPAEATASIAALKKLVIADVPWYEQSAITDNLLNAVVATVLTTAAQVRAGAKLGDVETENNLHNALKAFVAQYPLKGPTL